MQGNKTGFDVILSGQITSDDLYFPDGTVKYATPGGCCIWASIGAAFWSDRVAVFSRSGAQTNFPAAPFEAFGIAPRTLQAVLPTYLVRFRPQGQFTKPQHHDDRPAEDEGLPGDDGRAKA